MPRNSSLFVWANGLQNLGDQVVAAKTVLPALFHAAGVPAFFTAWLVPIRESGSMLPQAALTPWVSSHRSRKRVWLIGAVGQAASATGLGIAALLSDGALLGVLTLVCLASLSMFRALCSIAGKDVQGRTISKGERGLVTGRAAALGGAATLIVGLGLAWWGALTVQAIAVLILAAAATWVIAAGIFARVEEATPEATTPTRAHTWRMLREDRAFRDFVVVRALLVVSALATSFIVLLSPAGVAWFVLASGLAALLGGRVSGLAADASSKATMVWGAAAASAIIVCVLAAERFLPDSVNAVAIPLGFFLLNLAHTAIRVARKTYVVDMAIGDKRTQYVAAANTAMGAVLLLLGAITSGIALAGPQAGLAFLAAVGLIGVWRARALEDVSA